MEHPTAKKIGTFDRRRRRRRPDLDRSGCISLRRRARDGARSCVHLSPLGVTSDRGKISKRSFNETREFLSFANVSRAINARGAPRRSSVTIEKQRVGHRVETINDRETTANIGSGASG